MNTIALIANFWSFLLKCLNDNRGSISLTGGDGSPSPEPASGGSSGGNPESLVQPEGQTSNNLSNAGQSGNAPNFLSGLDEAIVTDPSLKVFQGEDGQFNVQNLIKSYVHAQKKIGEKGIQLPDKYATEEDWKSFYNKIRPAELDKYEVNAKVGEGEVLDEAMFKAFKESAHKNGLTTKQAQEIYNWYDSSIRQAVEQQQTQQNQLYEQEVAALQQEWGQGDSFKKEMSLAQRAISEFADEEMKAAIKKAGLDNNITMIRLFNKIGKSLLQEDTFNQESHGHFRYTKDEAERKLAQIYGDPNHAYWDAQHPSHKYAVEEVNKLHSVGIE